MKTKYIKDISTGEIVNDELFAVKSQRPGTTKDGKPFLDLVLSDKTGSLKAKAWSEVLCECDKVKEGDIVRTFGKVASFNGQPQLIISTIRITADYNLEDFTATSIHDLDEMEKDLIKCIKGIKNVHLKKLLQNIFDEKFLETYKKAPAAYTIHHAYIGGMIEHTLDILAMAEEITKRYPKINKDLLLTGIILHDVGKLEEYEVTTTINLTTRGKLLGHVYMGAEFVKIKAPKDMPEDLLNEVIHLILSHQGSKEFGSPVLPKTAEAIALSVLDDASFKINTAYHAIHDDNYEDEFTIFQRHLGTDLYKSPYLLGDE